MRTPVAFFEERYDVTSSGHVVNLANNTNLTPILNPNGYLKVGLATGDGKSKQVSIHRLVAEHFLPNPYGYKQVNHKNGDKTDNSVENLEWCSCLQNTHHAFKTNLRPGYMSADDKKHYLGRVLAGEQVKDIAFSINRRPETLHKMLRETAKRLGISHQWNQQMKENRACAAKRNLEKINS